MTVPIRCFGVWQRCFEQLRKVIQCFCRRNHV